MKLSKFYKNKKILVTGATGFKGAWLSYWLYILEHKVFAIGYSPNKNRIFLFTKFTQKVNIRMLDVRDFKNFSNYVNRSNLK